jgi:chromosome segregation ATPase
MAQRESQRARRTAVAQDQRTASAGADAARLAQIERERDELKARLVAAEARIAELEHQRVEVVNRIDWIIDSLQNVLETGR